MSSLLEIMDKKSCGKWYAYCLLYTSDAADD